MLTTKFIRCSLLGKTIPNLVTLEQGLYFKGKLHILGFMLDTEMEVTHPARLSVKATLDVIDIAGGLIRLKSADSKLTSGPVLHIVVSGTGVCTSVDSCFIVVRRPVARNRLLGKIELKIELKLNLMQKN